MQISSDGLNIVILMNAETLSTEHWFLHLIFLHVFIYVSGFVNAQMFKIEINFFQIFCEL